MELNIIGTQYCLTPRALVNRHSYARTPRVTGFEWGFSHLRFDWLPKASQRGGITWTFAIILAHHLEKGLRKTSSVENIWTAQSLRSISLDVLFWNPAIPSLDHGEVFGGWIYHGEVALATWLSRQSVNQSNHASKVGWTLTYNSGVHQQSDSWI